jgi:hypothetical protein
MTAMSTAARLRCLIYSHTWCVELLASQGFLRGRSLLVELAQESHLAAGCGLHGNRQPGLTPLLAPPSLKTRRWFAAPPPPRTLERALRQVWADYPGVGAPLVLAAYPALARGALESAVALLSQTPSEFDEVILLTHVSDVPWLLNVLPYAESFSVLWDIADLPNPSLPRMAEVLTRNEHLSPDRWGGFHLCNHPARKPDDEANRWIAWQRLLDAFPMLAGGAAG